jgi:hypothetical protein
VFVPTARDLVDVVVLAAIEASNLPAAQVRPLLHAVFRRARDMGLTLEAAEEALRPPVSDAGRAASGSRRPARSE